MGESMGDALRKVSCPRDRLPHDLRPSTLTPSNVQDILVGSCGGVELTLPDHCLQLQLHVRHSLHLPGNYPPLHHNPSGLRFM